MTHTTKMVLALTLVGALSLPARAQSNVRQLDLVDALKLAEENNLDLQAATVRMKRAELDISQARVSLMPSLALQGKYTHNGVEASFAMPGGGEPVVIQQRDALDGMLRLSVPVISASTWSNVAAARQGVASAESTFTATRTDILMRVSQAFYTAAGADELVAAQENAIELARKTLERSKARLEAGQTTRLDVSQAELALLRAQTAADETRQARATAYRGLKTLLQLEEPFQVVSKPLTPSTAEPRKRAEIAALEDSVAKIDLQAQATRRAWLPTLSAFGLATLSNYAGLTQKNYAWSVGLQLDWNVFDGGLRRVQASSLESARQETLLQLRLQEATLDDQVDEARAALETRGRSLEAAQQAIELAKESLELARARYDVGHVTQLDVLQAQDSLVQAEVAGARARFDLAIAGLSYERAVGVFLDRVDLPQER